MILLTLLLAIVAFLIFFCAFAWACERWSPVVMFIILLAVLAVAEAMAALGLGG